MTERFKTIVWLCIGYGFLVLGVLGLFLPFLQGILFILIGLAILSRYSVWARNLKRWLARRYPRVGEAMQKAEVRFRAWDMQRRVRARTKREVPRAGAD